MKKGTVEARRMSLRITKEDKATLEADARRLGVSVSDLARMILEAYLPQLRVNAVG